MSEPKKLLGLPVTYAGPAKAMADIAIYRRAPSCCGPCVRLTGGPFDGYVGTVDAILTNYPRPRAVLIGDRFAYHYEQRADGAFEFLLRIKRWTD